MEKIFVSVDWDYCTPIHIQNDWGHGESFLFLEIVWKMRQCLIEKENQLVLSPLSDLRAEIDIPIVSSNQVIVAESHCSAFHYFRTQVKPSDTVHLFHYDLHHDIWTPQKHSEVLAENWLYQLIRNTNANWHIVHIRPKWEASHGYSGDMFNEAEYVEELKKDCPNLVFWESTTEIPSISAATSVFLCRSGCWTSLILDDEFRRLCYKFIARSPLEKAKMYGKPLEPRWK